jgi:chromosome segregation ATPase
MKQVGIYVAVGLVVFGLLAWGVKAWTDYRLRQQIAVLEGRATQAEQQAEAAKEQAAGEIKQAKEEMARARQEADRLSRQNTQLIAERKTLLDRLTATANVLAQIREDALHVPASELLGRLRRALVALRQPLPSGGTAAH